MNSIYSQKHRPPHLIKSLNYDITQKKSSQDVSSEELIMIDPKFNVKSTYEVTKYPMKGMFMKRGSSI